MTKARDLADLIAAGNPLADGAISVAEISDLTVSAADLNNVAGINSSVQTQLDGKQPIVAGVSDTEIGYLDGVTSALQTQMDSKQAVVAGVSDTEIGYLNGVTSNLQSQLNNITVTAGSLTKSFLSGETANITLSSTVTSPVVAVTKEVPQAGASSKGAWDVASDGANYSVHNTAYNTTLTIGGTLSLASGSFSSSDVGKKIYVDDGGEAILIATDGSFKLVSAFGASSYTSGNWSMSSVDVDSSSGLTLSNIFAGEYDVTTASLSQNPGLAIDTQSNNSRAMAFKPDGTMVFVMDQNGGVFAYDLPTPWNVYGGTYSGAGYTASQGGSASGYSGLAFKPDGTKFFVIAGSNGSRVAEYSLSTPWDISTYSFIRHSSTITGGSNDGPIGLTFKPDGTQFFLAAIDNQRRFYTYTLSNPWDVTSITYAGSSSSKISALTPSGETYVRGMSMSTDGLRVYISGENYQSIYQFSVSPAWSVSNFTYVGEFAIPNNIEDNVTGVFIKDDGKSLYLHGAGYDRIYQYDLGSTSMPLNQYAVSVTGGGQIDTTYWTDINSMTADETVGDGEIYYAVSTDDHVTWSVIHDTNGARPIVRNNSSTWEYNSNATYTGTTWTSATTNDELSALQQALGANAANRMNSTQLNAVTDPNHYTLSTSLDLMIAFNQTSSSENPPSSDGVSINYDAATLNQGAVLGTDYTYDFPASNTLRVTSNATQNLKVRVV